MVRLTEDSDCWNMITIIFQPCSGGIHVAGLRT